MQAPKGVNVEGGGGVQHRSVPTPSRDAVLCRAAHAVRIVSHDLANRSYSRSLHTRTYLLTKTPLVEMGNDEIVNCPH